MDIRVNQRRLIARGRVFDITSENVTLPNGFTLELEIIRHPGASAIVPILENGNVLMLRQYRHAAGTCLWEIPAGTFLPDEDPLACARRELAEETGYNAEHWIPLTDIIPVPGYSDERIHLFLAHGLTPAQQRLDQDEVLEVQSVTIPEIGKMLADGQIKDAKTIAGLLLSAVRPGSPLSGLLAVHGFQSAGSSDGRGKITNL